MKQKHRVIKPGDDDYHTRNAAHLAAREERWNSLKSKIFHLFEIDHADYEAVKYEAMFNYVRLRQCDEWLMSDTFQKWWNQQYYIADSRFCAMLDDDDYSSQTRDYHWLHYQALHFLHPADIYPSNTLQLTIQSEIDEQATH